LAAYEVQASEIAASKADGLRRHYGIGPVGVRFWETHVLAEARHAAWSITALSEVDASESEITAATKSAACAWWNFLSDRQTDGERLGI
jgi:pyrroloquinoline quinone (PQQ) biosynthesis protein C